MITNRIDTKEDIFRFVYHEAIRDAVLQGAYKGKKDWMWRRETAEDRARVDHLMQPLKDYIDFIFDGELNEENHEKEFLKAAKAVRENFEKARVKLEEDGEFHFGNAQKLINMTAKHFYIATYYDKKLRKRFCFCHCPMDGIMLEEIWKLDKENLKGKGWKRETFVEAPWGSMDFESRKLPRRYTDFQSAVKSIADKHGCCPIELDYNLW